MGHCKPISNNHSSARFEGASYSFAMVTDLWLKLLSASTCDKNHKIMNYSNVANNIAYADVMLTLVWLWLVESILNHLVTHCQRLEMPPILNNEFKPLMNWVGTASQIIIHEDTQKLLSNHFLQMSLGAWQKLPTDWSICPGCLPLIGLFVHM